MPNLENLDEALSIRLLILLRPLDGCCCLLAVDVVTVVVVRLTPSLPLPNSDDDDDITGSVLLPLFSSELDAIPEEDNEEEEEEVL